MTTDQDPLEPLLHQWRDETQAHSLTGEVWREIERRDAARSTSGFLDRLEAVFARPSFSVVFVISCILFGLFLAEIRVAQIQSDRSAALARSYLQLVNPLLEEADR
jgi:hypothetical protein